MGLYAFAPLDESEQHVMQLNTALRSASKKVIPGVVGHRELTLLRICANSKQYVTKTVTAVPKAEEKPADLVFENILPSITVARATFVLQHTLLVSEYATPLALGVSCSLYAHFRALTALHSVTSNRSQPTCTTASRLSMTRSPRRWRCPIRTTTTNSTCRYHWRAKSGARCATASVASAWLSR